MNSFLAFRRNWPVFVLATSLVVGGCLRSTTPERKAGSAVWVDPTVAVPSSEEILRLNEIGIEEIFLEAGRLDLGVRSAELRPLSLPRISRRVPAMLVVRASWPSENVEAAELGAAVASRLRELRLSVEASAGVLVEGWHLDFAVPPTRIAELGAVLRTTRKVAEPGLRISLQVSREQLGNDELRQAVEPVDFLVAMLYGQRPGEDESAEAWDLLAVERHARALEALDRPFLLGAAVTGMGYRISVRGDRVAETTELDLEQLATDPHMELKRGFSLEGVDRQVYQFVSRRSTSAGPWLLEPGETVRVVKTATPLLEEWLRRIGVWNLKLQLGVLFYRCPAPGERLALGVAHWIAALDAEAATPRPVVELERLQASNRVWKVRLRLRNLSEEPSDLSILSHNVVRLRLEGALIGNVDPGNFRRYDLAFQGSEVRTLRALRTPDTLLLFVPILEGGALYETGAIELRLQQSVPRVLTEAEFLTAEGQVASAAVQEWVFEEKR